MFCRPGFPETNRYMQSPDQNTIFLYFRVSLRSMLFRPRFLRPLLTAMRDNGQLNCAGSLHVRTPSLSEGMNQEVADLYNLLGSFFYIDPTDRVQRHVFVIFLSAV